jgi:hypothetical protein
MEAAKGEPEAVQIMVGCVRSSDHPPRSSILRQLMLTA